MILPVKAFDNPTKWSVCKWVKRYSRAFGAFIHGEVDEDGSLGIKWGREGVGVVKQSTRIWGNSSKCPSGS